MSYVVEMRRRLHRYPEIGFDLPRTLALVKEELTRFGISYTEEYGRSSIVATVNPEKQGLTVGLRADMDALPVTEKTGLPYRSKLKGQMHACGHDAHTAILLDVARRLSELRSTLPCCVKLLFQPAEEYAPSGARLMAEDGAVDDIDCLLALHVDPAAETGRISVKTGPLNASSTGFRLDFYGRSAHVAQQERGADAIAMAVQTYDAIHRMLAKELPFDRPRIFNAGKIEGGTAINVIASHASLSCTLRTHDEETEDFIVKRIKEIATQTAKLGGGRATFTPLKRLPIVYNDDAVTERLLSVAEELLGKESLLEWPRSTIGEDFSYFANRKPACLFFLGVRNEEKRCVYSLHQDRFDLDEDALAIGSELFVRFVLSQGD